jgi:hypothetical protein
MGSMVSSHQVSCRQQFIVYLLLNLNNRLLGWFPYPNGQILNKPVCCLTVLRLFPLSPIHSHAV